MSPSSINAINVLARIASWTTIIAGLLYFFGYLFLEGFYGKFNVSTKIIQLSGGDFITIGATSYIICELKKDKSSDPKEPPDCSRWNN